MEGTNTGCAQHCPFGKASMQTTTMTRNLIITLHSDAPPGPCSNCPLAHPAGSPSSLHLAIFVLSSFSTRSTAPGWQLHIASISSFAIWKPMRLSTFWFSVFQLYIFCWAPLAELQQGEGERNVQRTCNQPKRSMLQRRLTLGSC